MQPLGLSGEKLHIKNYRVYAIAWLATVLIGEFLISFLDSDSTTSAGTFLFGGMVMTAVTGVSAWWLGRAKK